jgi:quercetin dioxygenase-like cupin family protein
MSETFTFVDNLSNLVPDIPEDSILSRTFYSDERVKAIIFGFAPGQELSEHTASQPAILYFAQGEADLMLGDETRKAQAGTWVHMPAHLSHSIVAKTPLVMLLLLMQSHE